MIVIANWMRDSRSTSESTLIFSFGVQQAWSVSDGSKNPSLTLQACFVE